MKKKIAIAVFMLGIVLGTCFVPVSSALAQTQGGESSVPSFLVPNYDNPEYEKKLGTCGFDEWTPCLMQVYYWLILYPSSWFAYLTGSLFDYFVAYSLDTASYQGTNAEFVEKGWGIMRDISNIIFIFAILYVAIMHILQGADSKTKKFLKSIIIYALLINFSLFFTKIIIDGGNILARAFYNNIEVENDDNQDHKTLSMGIISKVSIQNLLSADLFNPVDAPGRAPGKVDNGWMFLVMVVATIVNVILGFTFLSTFLLFAARVIGLWFMMIFSPLAFASKAIPEGSGMMGRFGFSKWLEQTMSLSFMAPVFMFFFFLLAMFLDIAFTTNTSFTDQSSVQKFLAILVPFIAVIIIIGQAKTVAKKMAGEFGEQTTKWVGKAAGYAATGALALAGGAAFVGRNTVGAAGTAISRSAMLRNGLQSDSWLARNTSKVVSAGSRVASSSSFDARNTWAGKKAVWAAGQAVDTATGEKLGTKFFGTDMAKGAGVGGFRKQQRDKAKENIKKQKQYAADDELKGDELASLRKAEKNKNQKTEAAKKIEKDMEEIAKKRVLTSDEREQLAKAKQEATEAEATYSGIKGAVDDINNRRRSNRAAWQKRFFWKPGSGKAAEAVKKGEKPEDEAADLLAKMKKFVEKNEKGGKKEEDGHDKGGKHDDKHDKPKDGGPKVTVFPSTNTGGGHDGGHKKDDHPPHPHGSFTAQSYSPPMAGGSGGVGTGAARVVAGAETGAAVAGPAAPLVAGAALAANDPRTSAKMNRIGFRRPGEREEG